MPEISILYKLKKTRTSLNKFLSFLNFTNYVYVILIYHFKSHDSKYLFFRVVTTCFGLSWPQLGSSKSHIHIANNTCKRLKVLIVMVITEYIMLLAQQPPGGHGLLIHDVSRSHTTTHHSPMNSSGRVTSLSQRPLLDNT